MLTKNNLDNYLIGLEKQDEGDKNNLGFDKLNLPESYRKLINALVEVHGGGQVIKKRSGKDVGSIELRLPDPELLKEDGDKELFSQHLFVNITKVVEDQHTMAARCVKDGRVYNVNTLLSMLPIEKRMAHIPKSKLRRNIIATDYTQYYEEDENGNLIPPGPGATVPLTKLEDGHPAVVYVKSRGFDPEHLVEQFSACYCTKENPKLFYKTQPGGFKVTPQGRIVFWIEQLGAKRGWQARRLEYVSEDGLKLFYWHPYQGSWANVAIRKNPTDDWVTIGDYHDPRHSILQNKYNIGLGVVKSNLLMGFDAARAWSEKTGKRTIGVVEGVLDAARLGPPFVSLMGLTASTSQGALIKNFFNDVVVVPDQDKDPNKREQLLTSLEVVLRNTYMRVIDLPRGVKDAGDLSEDQVIKLRTDLGFLKYSHG